MPPRLSTAAASVAFGAIRSRPSPTVTRAAEKLPAADELAPGVDRDLAARGPRELRARVKPQLGVLHTEYLEAATSTGPDWVPPASVRAPWTFNAPSDTPASGTAIVTVASWSTSTVPPLRNVPRPSSAEISCGSLVPSVDAYSVPMLTSRAPLESSRSPSSVFAAFPSVRCESRLGSGDASQPSALDAISVSPAPPCVPASQRKRCVTETVPAPISSPPVCTSSPMTASAANSTCPPYRCSLSGTVVDGVRLEAHARAIGGQQRAGLRQQRRERQRAVADDGLIARVRALHHQLAAGAYEDVRPVVADQPRGVAQRQLAPIHSGVSPWPRARPYRRSCRLRRARSRPWTFSTPSTDPASVAPTTTTASWSTTRLPPLTNAPPPAPAVIFASLVPSAVA